jgi:hypothetical protein
VAVVGLIATPLLVHRASRNLPPEQRPRTRTYILSSIAFVVWALATSRLGALAGLDEEMTAVIMGISVFLIPLIDDFFTKKTK